MKTIKAFVGPDMLSVVDRLFQAGLKSIVSELAQNARRAGATELDIYVRADGAGGSIVEMQDNGPGMAEPDVLLGLRASDWADQHVADEDPAGMGFFVLSGMPWSAAASCGWKIRLTPESFKGAEVVVHPSGQTRGMRIRFPQPDFPPGVTRESLRGLRSFLDLCGLVVRIDGTAVIARNFLHDAHCKKRRLCETYEDLGVAVCATNDSSYEYKSGGRSYGRLLFNFFGFTGWSTWAGVPCVAMRVDIKNAKSIRPVLPARGELVENAYMQVLRTRLEKLAFKLVAGDHDLPFSFYTRAAELGVDIGHAWARLRPVSNDARDPYNRAADVISRAAVISRPSVWGEWQNYAATSPGGCQLYVCNQRMAGYAWYDALPEVRSARLLVDGLVLVEELSDEPDRKEITWDEAPQRGATAIEFDMLIGGDESTHTCEVIALLRPSDDFCACASDIPTFIVSSEAGSEDVVDICDMIEDAWMPQEWPDDDDSEAWSREVRSIVTAVVAPAGSMSYGVRVAVDAAMCGILYPDIEELSEGCVSVSISKEFDNRAWRASWQSIGKDDGEGTYRMLVTRTKQETTIVTLDAANVRDAARLAVVSASDASASDMWTAAAAPTYKAAREDAMRG